MKYIVRLRAWLDVEETMTWFMEHASEETAI
jgi:hypothetical protein